MPHRYAEHLFNNILDAVIVTDLQFNISLWNKAAENLYGWEATEVIGQPFGEVVPTTYLNGEMRASVIEQFLQHGFWQGDVQQIDRFGEKLYISTRVSLRKDEAGNPIGALAANRDITERKQAQIENERLILQLQKTTRLLKRHAKRLANKNRELEQFAYVASHDLQEPLRKIQAFGHRLQDKYGTQLDDKGGYYLERMIDSASRGRELIHNLLDYARFSEQKSEAKQVSLTAVALEVKTGLDMLVEESGGEIIIAELPEAIVHPSQIRQLLQNLISNGLKFHRPACPPVVKVEGQLLLPEDERPSHWPTGQALLLTVQDNGLGIAPQYQKRIFNLFQRLHSKNEYPGTGIGLAICRRVVEEHDGLIEVQSQEGEGTTFQIILPQDHAETIAAMKAGS